jgi:hypothetical protein
VIFLGSWWSLKNHEAIVPTDNKSRPTQATATQFPIAAGVKLLQGSCCFLSAAVHVADDSSPVRNAYASKLRFFEPICAQA